VVQAPAPHHAFPHGRAGPGLLAHIAVAKFHDNLPLYRQAAIYAGDGVALPTSTRSGWLVGTAAISRRLTELLRREAIGGSDVLHGDDTQIPVLIPGTGKTSIGRLWTYVRGERPHGGARPLAAMFFASPDRRDEPPAPAPCGLRRRSGGRRLRRHQRAVPGQAGIRRPTEAGC
jgi:hypothetical protein